MPEDQSSFGGLHWSHFHIWENKTVPQRGHGRIYKNYKKMAQQCHPSMSTALDTGISLLLPSTILPDLSPQDRCVLMGATVVSVGVSSQNEGPMETN